MEAVIIRAGGFLFIIALGFFLKRIGVFGATDKDALTTLIMKVTMPISLATNFRTLQLDMSYMVAFLFGLFSNLLIISAVLFLFRKKSAVQRVFLMINGSGYNIGLCAIPFLQSFFTSEALTIVCLFDMGNAIFVFGFLIAIATMLTKEGEKFTAKDAVKILMRSVPFVTYIVMILLTVASISLPSAVYDTFDIIAAANPFLAMLLIGIMFEPKLKMDVLGDLGRVAMIRFVASAVFIFITVQFLPMSTTFKQALCLVLVSPIPNIAPIYIKKFGGDDGAAAVANSLMLPISMVIMTIMLGIFQVV